MKIKLEKTISSHPVTGWNARGQSLVYCRSIREAINAGAEYVRQDGRYYRIIDRHRQINVDPLNIVWVN